MIPSCPSCPDDQLDDFPIVETWSGRYPNEREKISPPAPTRCSKCGIMASETICHLCGTPRA